LSTAPMLTPAAEVPVPMAAPEPPPPLPGPETTAPPPPTPPQPPLPDAPEELAYVIVNEAGASDYSASPIAKEEFPNLDATLRGRSASRGTRVRAGRAPRGRPGTPDPRAAAVRFAGGGRATPECRRADGPGHPRRLRPAGLRPARRTAAAHLQTRPAAARRPD